MDQQTVAPWLTVFVIKFYWNSGMYIDTISMAAGQRLSTSSRDTIVLTIPAVS